MRRAALPRSRPPHSHTDPKHPPTPGRPLDSSASLFYLFQAVLVANSSTAGQFQHSAAPVAPVLGNARRTFTFVQLCFNFMCAALPIAVPDLYLSVSPRISKRFRLTSASRCRLNLRTRRAPLPRFECKPQMRPFPFKGERPVTIVKSTLVISLRTELISNPARLRTRRAVSVTLHKPRGLALPCRQCKVYVVTDANAVTRVSCTGLNVWRSTSFSSLPWRFASPRTWLQHNFAPFLFSVSVFSRCRYTHLDFDAVNQ